MESIACPTEECNSLYFRKFEMTPNDKYKSLTEGFRHRNAQYATMLDLDHDGILDFVVVTFQHRSNKMIAVYNNYERDAFFITSMMVDKPELFSTLLIRMAYFHLSHQVLLMD